MLYIWPINLRATALLLKIMFSQIVRTMVVNTEHHMVCWWVKSNYIPCVNFSVSVGADKLHCFHSVFFYLERVDQAGVICKQEGIFRVNCMDCLDRTNVVQAAIARVVMEQQACITNVIFKALSSSKFYYYSRENSCLLMWPIGGYLF